MSDVPACVNSVTTLFTAKVGQADSAKSCENSPRKQHITKIVEDVASPHPKSPKSNALVTSKITLNATAAESSMKVHMPKTTKTYELRRKAGEERVKERIAKEHAEKLNATLAPEKPSPAIEPRKKSIASKTTVPSIAPRKFIPSSTKRPAASNAMKRLHDMLYPQERAVASTKSVEVQTCSTEITDNMLIGDAKVMSPSPKLWADILKKREQDLKEAMLREVRQVPEHSKDEVNYQSNLKEFLETGTVKRYERKVKRGDERKDVFKRAAERPKARPEMDLKKRLKNIEGELMNVFKPRT